MHRRHPPAARRRSLPPGQARVLRAPRPPETEPRPIASRRATRALSASPLQPARLRRPVRSTRGQFPSRVGSRLLSRLRSRRPPRHAHRSQPETPHIPPTRRHAIRTIARPRCSRLRGEQHRHNVRALLPRDSPHPRIAASWCVRDRRLLRAKTGASRRSRAPRRAYAGRSRHKVPPMQLRSRPAKRCPSVGPALSSPDSHSAPQVAQCVGRRTLHLRIRIRSSISPHRHVAQTSGQLGRRCDHGCPHLFTCHRGARSGKQIPDLRPVGAFLQCGTGIGSPCCKQPEFFRHDENALPHVDAPCVPNLPDAPYTEGPPLLATVG